MYFESHFIKQRCCRLLWIAANGRGLWICFFSTNIPIVHGRHRERGSRPPPYTLNLYKIFINHLELQKSFVTHSNSCCVTPVGGNLPPNSPNFLLHVFHYKIAHSFFIFYPIFNFKMFSYVKTHYLQVLLNKYFS